MVLICVRCRLVRAVEGERRRTVIKPVLSSQTTIRPSQTKAMENIDTAADFTQVSREKGHETLSACLDKHEFLPTQRSSMNCKCVTCIMMTEIYTIAGGQKDGSSLEGTTKKKLREPGRKSYGKQYRNGFQPCNRQEWAKNNGVT